ncbi:hypothetical protein ASPZODRAFT_57051 [Penicilliopsis zonata CBS 506.65]|uniref:Centromere protein H C-terminal domain-containing protein n=1 Tax=Penicilliopsis zonata CBS 506.65 TaxID=1073090 RepID=A0A1L9SWJ1_9EURO|nr:hypothetical protein ASPZODRAFT_57051 [Penicilliopsis zonata CBS 506.65]OJJ51560.1 hypothetical protein ASPZODRAFT_57051 [Penicilliopsis zonata CBS 506.65]
MASNVDIRGPLPHLSESEGALLSLVEDDSQDAVALSDKEALILELYRKSGELELEKEFLSQEPGSYSGEDVEAQLAVAERELLEARATHTVRRKAINTILMADPILKAVHLKANSPPEREYRALLKLINRRDILSLVHENLAAAHDLTLKNLSDMEVENMELIEKNRALTQELLGLARQQDAWKEGLEDTGLAAQLEGLEKDRRKVQARWEIMQNIASAIVVGSGVNWAENADLRALVLDEED